MLDSRTLIKFTTQNVRKNFKKIKEDCKKVVLSNIKEFLQGDFEVELSDFKMKIWGEICKLYFDRFIKVQLSFNLKAHLSDIICDLIWEVEFEVIKNLKL